jgi:nucleoside-diphosphate-sugar epimerase
MTGFQRVQADRPQRARRDGARRTIVTGGTGFIGAYVASELLAQRREVIVLDVKDYAPEGRFVLGERAADVSFERGSIDDRARLFDLVRAFDPDEIVHMAMLVDPAFLVPNRDTGFRVNVEGTLNVLEAMVLFGVERLVNFSSIGVLTAVQYEPIDARHPVLLPTMGSGTGFYGAMKVASEALCFAYHQALGIDFATIRPSAVYGLGMNDFPGPIKKLVEGAVRGEPVHFETGGAHRRDYTHAADIASLVLAVLGAPPDADRIFYGATGEPLATTSEVAALVREVVSGADVSIGEELSEAERPIAALRGQLSIENARAQLGWAPAYASLRSGIERYVADYGAFIAASR